VPMLILPQIIRLRWRRRISSYNVNLASKAQEKEDQAMNEPEKFTGMDATKYNEYY